VCVSDYAVHQKRKNGRREEMVANHVLIWRCG
jgi:hypothetical protein